MTLTFKHTVCFSYGTLSFKWSLTYVWALLRGGFFEQLGLLRVRFGLLLPLLFYWSTEQGLDCTLLHVFIHWEGFLFKNWRIKAIFSTSYKQPHDSISSSVHLTRVAQCNSTLERHEYLCAFRISCLFLIRTWRSCKSGHYLCLNGENPPALPPWHGAHPAKSEFRIFTTFAHLFFAL